MKECFLYMFKFDNSKKNIGILFGLLFVAVLLFNLAAMFSPVNMYGDFSPLFVIFLIAGILVVLLPFGYAVSCIKSLISKQEKLPGFELKNNFITGTKFLLSFISLTLIVCFIFLILGFLNHFFITRDLIPLSFLVSAFSFLITIVVSFILPAAFYNFAKTDELSSCVKFPAIIKLINKNVNNYFKYFIVFLVLIIITLLIKNFLFFHLNFFGYVGLFIYTTLLSLIYTYTSLVCAKIITVSVEE